MENQRQTTAKVPIAVADRLIQIIRLLAHAGKKEFSERLFQPLRFAGWEHAYGADTTRKLMENIDRAARSNASRHTVGPLCKRLISLALKENLSTLGDCCIFFLEKMKQVREAAVSREAVEFAAILQPPLEEFSREQAARSETLFVEELEHLSSGEFQEAFAPIHLGKHKIKVELQREAYSLFEQIKAAASRSNYNRCRQLIARYLIRHGDQQDNNRDEVDKLITALDTREKDFRRELEQSMATALYFKIIGGVTDGNLKQAIRGIRKYAHIFHGNPEILYHNDIDRMEKILYSIIRKKDLWQQLKK